MKCVVVTTIQGPTPSMTALSQAAQGVGMPLLVIGDRKTPEVAWPSGARFFSLADQRSSEFRLAPLLPENHYTRKNFGYLAAISEGARAIFDTDDDNAPTQDWRPREEFISAVVIEQQGWVNAYRWFSAEFIWPRGLPLEHAKSAIDATAAPTSPLPLRASIQQGLVNGSPDVDAIWRLLYERDVRFEMAESIALRPGAWCPFNSQSTWWFPRAYPLLYLPSQVSFRMTDIWRSFVAQRCLWELDEGVVFHAPDMVQDRNPHDLLKDFEQEIPGYLGNERIRRALEGAQLKSSDDAVAGNLHSCYEALVRAGLVPAGELGLVEAWLSDVAAVSARESHVAP